MEVFVFQVQGSASDPYEVRFVVDAGHATASCTCAAGTALQLCKHRLHLLDGDFSACIDLTPGIDARLHQAVASSELVMAFNRLRAAEAQTASARAAESSAKRALNRIMSA